MNIIAFRSMKDFWNKQSSGLMGPGGKGGGNYFLEAREVSMFLDPSKKYRCLEVGCGSGEIHRELCGFYEGYTGVDFSASNLEVFHAQHPDADLICSDVLAFETDKRYDLIHSNHMVQFLTVQQISLMQKKLLALCKPGGLIVHRGFLDRRLKSLYFSGYLYPGINQRILKWRLHPLLYRVLQLFNKITGTCNQLGYWITREEILRLHKRLGAEVEIYNSPLHPNRFNIIVRRR